MSEFTMADGRFRLPPFISTTTSSTDAGRRCRLIPLRLNPEKGATIAAFGECWEPGYPMFAFLPPTPKRWQVSGAYIESAVQVSDLRLRKALQGCKAGEH